MMRKAMGMAGRAATLDGRTHESVNRLNEPSPQQMLKLVEDHGQIGLWSIDLKTGENRLSEGFYRITGLMPSNSIGDVLHDLFHPDDLRIREEMAAALLAGIPIHREFRIVRPDRTVRWIEFKAEIVLDAHARPAQANGVIFDITGRHEAHRLIQRSEARYQGLVQAIASVVWTATQDGFARSCPGWFELTGQSESEWHNGGWDKAVHPDDRVRSWNAWRTAVANGAPYDEDLRIKCTDGRYRWLNSRAIPVLNEDRSVREWIGVMVALSDGTRYRPSADESAPDVITGSLVRCARAMLNWSIGDLATAAGVSGSSIKRFEDEGGTALRERTRVAVRKALENAGITFLAPQPGKVGIIFEPKVETAPWRGGDFDI
ncbi:PAS domain-containing protein [Methylobacterium sp. BTF04]|uniref:PAS domain-containing protein n=1 Tax=Methylobacterium sp. BTF04 TaxID=2708300 RepID=UPI0013D73CD5|nr:PAS domain-containing protein [Methylobacterium sp. BTF04]NEU13920.1 PAS domain-containing protein [Methylobacterium sp. BTF04]